MACSQLPKRVISHSEHFPALCQHYSMDVSTADLLNLGALNSSDLLWHILICEISEAELTRVILSRHEQSPNVVHKACVVASSRDLDNI